MSHEHDTLFHLHNRGAITPMIALKEYGNFRLSSDIHRLRREGYKIKTTIHRAGKSQWAVYELEDNAKA